MGKGSQAVGYDVLLFFDFAGLPQIGKSDSGALIVRTDEETKLFQEALPAMGALYSMYPVLVIPQVTPGVPPDTSSGWCFSEFATAMLARQLDMYSNDALEEYVAALLAGGETSKTLKTTIDTITSGKMRAEDRNEFMSIFELDLATKNFFNESDRNIVHGNVQGHLISRLLCDAVLSQNIEAVHSHLGELKQLKAAELTSTINDPIDESLDTLLHTAVKLPSKEIVEALCASGADPECRILAWRFTHTDLHVPAVGAVCLGVPLGWKTNRWVWSSGSRVTECWLGFTRKKCCSSIVDVFIIPWIYIYIHTRMRHELDYYMSLLKDTLTALVARLEKPWPEQMGPCPESGPE